jgi:hypothetical protein
VTPRTAVRVEKGDPIVGIGIAFDLATLCGVPLFGVDRTGLERELAKSRDRLSLLPSAGRTVRRRDDDDEF